MAKFGMINIRDYPADKYTHYWQITVEMGAERWLWNVEFLPFNRGADHNTADPSIDRTAGVTGDGYATTEEDARRESQQFVLDHIEQYRRP